MEPLSKVLMKTALPPEFSLSSEVARARALNLPLVALESAVITHGLPVPENLQSAREMESEVRALGATPATIAVMEGKVCVGLNEVQLERLAKADKKLKISSRDLSPAIILRESGGTTVAATLAVAYVAGIQVFATGGIGGVHRQAPFDVSADLSQLARTPVVVVCAGAKAILDLPATLEALETLGVPVIGYQTDEFPAFYSRNSGLKVSARADSPDIVARLAYCHWSLGMESAILVTVPPPAEEALPNGEVQRAVHQALREAQEAKVIGQEVTPFLLRRVSELTKGASRRANMALLRNNARLAANIARHMEKGNRVRHT